MKSEYLRGIAYALLFAVPAYVLGKFFPIIGGPVFGILLGMCFARLARPKNFEAGISFTGKKILQYAIILLGFEMNLCSVGRFAVARCHGIDARDGISRRLGRGQALGCRG